MILVARRRRKRVKDPVIEIKRRADYVKQMKASRTIVYIILIISVIVFLAIAVIAILNEGVANFIATVWSINPLYYLAAFVVLFISYAMKFPKWEMYLNSLKVKLNRWDDFVVYMSMYSMDITPGRWGRAIVSYTINNITGTNFARTFPAVVADIFTDFLGFGILTVAAALFVQKYILLSMGITALLLLPFLFVYTRAPFEFLRKKFAKIKRFKEFFQLGEIYFKENKRLGTKDYLYSMGLTLPSVILTGLSLYFVILAFGIHIGLAQLPLVIFIYCSSLLFGIISGVPGTLGVTDAILVGYLTAFFPGFGITLGVASVITIFFRIVSVWFVQGFSSIALFYSIRKWDV